MARDRDEDFKSRRRREEREEEQAQADTKPSVGSKAGRPGSAAPAASESPDALIRQIEPTLEQLNHLYNMYANGVEKRPPVEKRALVESWVQKLLEMSKATPASRFRVQTLYASYQAHRDRWERILKAKESGR